METLKKLCEFSSAWTDRAVLKILSILILNEKLGYATFDGDFSISFLHFFRTKKMLNKNVSFFYKINYQFKIG